MEEPSRLSSSRGDRKLARKVVAIHAESRGRYGTPRVQQALERMGARTSRKRVVAESLFKTLRAELVRGHRFATHQAAHRAVFGYIEGFYKWVSQYFTFVCR
ncbi:MAG: IS3 family transposase [Thermoanaerobaculia bacterium]|nr:IS3 family transposase [Thermoanaerobaculia bacterium]